MGEFRIVGRLGQGGQGVVYLAESPDGGQAAVKVMTGGIDRTFARELAAARMVDEFCTARVLVADLDHDPPYVASEYIDGPALSAAGPVRGAALIRLAIGTVTALAAIHRAGVVHRDFKPANVLLGPDGPRVIDFGIARLVDATVTKGSASGTPPYMAPEQLSETSVGPASDMFSWGSTMTFAATGRPPFGRDTFPAVAYRILHGEPGLGDLAEPLRGIVRRCLAKDPAQRPTARAVLLELLGEDPGPMPPATSGPATSGPSASASGPAGSESGAPGLATSGPDASWPAAGSAGVPAPDRDTPPGSLIAPSPAGESAPGPFATPPPAGTSASEPAAREPDAAGRGAAGHGRVGRRAVLAGLGAVTVAAATTGGVVWWREARLQSSGRGATVTGLPATGSSNGTTSTPPSGSPSASTTAEEPISPPRPHGQELAIAMESAISVWPMADMTFQGGLTQSDFFAEVHGRIRFQPDEGESAGSCDFAMKVAAPEVGTIDVVVMAPAGPDDLYVNRKRLAADAEYDGRGYIDMIVIMSGLGVILDLVAHTSQVSGAGRRYSGGLDTGSAPSPIKEQLAGPANWKLGRLKGTRISWNIQLDTANRPKTFVLSWRASAGGSELSSTYTSTYKKWRRGEIKAPG
ncbi:serine/threonine protein kinase [Nonomuraea sp. CA-141351]|uniref:serine/threonine protein kinase n=1 Tax=Nonomuraea sp. CA-141351 TaxID=3239996 RepID=UPI003D905CC8